MFSFDKRCVWQSIYGYISSEQPYIREVLFVPLFLVIHFGLAFFVLSFGFFSPAPNRSTASRTTSLLWSARPVRRQLPLSWHFMSLLISDNFYLPRHSSLQGIGITFSLVPMAKSSSSTFALRCRTYLHRAVGTQMLFEATHMLNSTRLRVKYAAALEAAFIGDQ
jgi:hypothetical protein